VNTTFPENVTVGTEVYAPAAQAGITYAFLSGNDGATAPFALDNATGRITVASALDYETVQSYVLRISAVNTLVPCQNGIFFVNVAVGDLNDVAPTFSGAPYTVSVGIDTPANSNVLLAQAGDDGGGAPLVYTMVVTTRRAQRSRRQTPDFAIDAATGQITTTVLIDGSTTSYQLDVSATDGTFVGTAAVAITVAPCDSCTPSIEYLVSSCSGGSTAVICANVTMCPEGTFMQSDFTPTANRDCQPCPPDTFQATAAHTATACNPHTPCSPGFSSVPLPTTTTNTNCILGTAAPTSPTEAPTAPTAAPTAAPTSAAPTSPTAVPTAGPTTSPVAAPTSAPTPPPTAPTPSPTAAPNVAVNDASSSSDGTDAIVWWPALLVLVALLLLLVYIVRRKKDKVDTRDESEIMMAAPIDGQFVFGQAQSGQGNIYAMGNSGDVGDAIYDQGMASSEYHAANAPGSRRDGNRESVYDMAENNESVYDMAETGEAVYDMGRANDDVAYDVSRANEEEAVYDIGGTGSTIPVGSARYSAGRAGGTGEEEAVYDIGGTGSTVPVGSTRYSRASNDEAVYDMGGSDTIGDIGAGDQFYDNAPSGWSHLPAEVMYAEASDSGPGPAHYDVPSGIAPAPKGKKGKKDKKKKPKKGGSVIVSGVYMAEEPQYDMAESNTAAYDIGDSRPASKTSKSNADRKYDRGSGQ
jgi:hypothetical protein